MGCDIHAVIERKVGDKWVMLNRLSYKDSATDRNYKRFAALAGVRGDGPKPKGLPTDISDSTKLYYDEWEPDAHSASWIDLKKAAKLFLDTEYEGVILSDFAKTYPKSHYFNVDLDIRREPHRLVYWFDN